MRIFDDVPGDTGRRPRRFYRCPGLWCVAALIYAPMIAYWLDTIVASPSRGPLAYFVAFSQLLWPVIMLTATVLSLALTIRRKCEAWGVLIAWASLGIGFYFFWEVYISHPW